MFKQLKRISGFLLMVVAALGILGCLVIIALAIRQRPQLIASAEDSTQIIITSLKNANTGLKTTKETLSHSADVLQATRNSIQQLAGTISDLDPMLYTTQNIIGNDLREVIIATQNSLVTAEESAQNVDRLLFALDSISFLTGVSYDPDQTLAEGIAGISEELKPIPSSFQELAEELGSTGQNLSDLELEINKIEKSLGNFDQIFIDVEAAVDKIENVNVKLEQDLIAFKDNLSRSINRFVTLTVIVLFWMVVLQLGLFFQGAEMAGIFFGENRPDSSNRSSNSHSQQ
jgi:chromosome segregation ATPase